MMSSRTSRAARGVSAAILIGLLTLLAQDSRSAGRANPGWYDIIRNTAAAVKYYSPGRGTAWTTLSRSSTREKDGEVEEIFTDGRVDVTLRFLDRGSRIEMTGEISHTKREDICLTLKLTEPLASPGGVVWSHDLDSARLVDPGDLPGANFVDAKTVPPPAGAFNTDAFHNGGYGDNVGEGRMSFFPVAAIASGDRGLAWGIDMGVPLVYRLSYDPAAGMTSEFDMAVVPETTQFPGRAYFKLLFFECDAAWGLRSALQRYYALQAEYFRKRIVHEGTWLPFAPLYEIKGWEDFGFAFHETNSRSKDRAFHPSIASIEAGRRAHVLTFQYTEPWEEEIPIPNRKLSYGDVTGKGIITSRHDAYMKTSAALDKAGRLIARKLETPWFRTGWAVSINTNPDPDIAGFSRYRYERRNEVDPALTMDADGIYFDCLEWHWQYDLNYNRAHFPAADYPLTFSTSLPHPRPAIWGYAPDYEFVRRIADEMHRQGKFVMGNSFTWIPYSAGLLDVFGSELSLYVPADTRMERLQFARAMAFQKPVVFLMNEGLDDSLFTAPPYSGYRMYFDRMLLYGFFPSFFSTNAVSNNYWSDSTRYGTGRPFFLKYIPLIRSMARAGWQPVTLARLSNRTMRVERFGEAGDSTLYFAVYNPSTAAGETRLCIDAAATGIGPSPLIEELIDGSRPVDSMNGGSFELTLRLEARSANLIRIRKTGG